MCSTLNEIWQLKMLFISVANLNFHWTKIWKNWYKMCLLFRISCPLSWIIQLWVFYLEVLKDSRILRISSSKLLTDFNQSSWFSFERPTNCLNQNIALSRIYLQEWLKSPHICKCSTSKFHKIFSAICWSPGLVIIFSISTKDNLYVFTQKVSLKE